MDDLTPALIEATRERLRWRYATSGMSWLAFKRQVRNEGSDVEKRVIRPMTEATVGAAEAIQRVHDALARRQLVCLDKLYDLATSSEDLSPTARARILKDFITLAQDLRAKGAPGEARPPAMPPANGEDGVGKIPQLLEENPHLRVVLTEREAVVEHGPDADRRGDPGSPPGVQEAS